MLVTWLKEGFEKTNDITNAMKAGNNFANERHKIQTCKYEPLLPQLSFNHSTSRENKITGMDKKKTDSWINIIKGKIASSNTREA